MSDAGERPTRRCGFCGEPSVRRARATEIVAHGIPLGMEQHWICGECGQQFATLSPLLYLLLLGGAVSFAAGAVFGPIAGDESSRLIARLLLLGFAITLAVLGGSRLRADRRNRPLPRG